jgi:arylsulfatase A
VDDLGYGDFSRFNGGRSTTPVLDSPIDEAVCFTRSYTASPVSSPSRAAFLTGRYPHRTGSIDTLEWHGLDRRRLVGEE